MLADTLPVLFLCILRNLISYLAIQEAPFFDRDHRIAVCDIMSEGCVQMGLEISIAIETFLVYNDKLLIHYTNM